MKKIRFLVLLLLFSASARAQGPVGDIVNGDFINICDPLQYPNLYVNPAANYQMVGDCWTFDEPCLPNWYRTHGTPWHSDLLNYYPGQGFIQLMAGIDPTYGQNAVAISEGLAGYYNFKKDYVYFVDVKVTDIYSPWQFGQSFKFDLNIAMANVSASTQTQYCAEPAPTITSMEMLRQEDLVALQQNYISWTIKIKKYVPSNDYQSLWLYTYSTIPGNNSNIGQPACTLDRVKIYHCLQGSVGYHGEQIPTGVTAKSKITVDGPPQYPSFNLPSTTFVGEEIIINPVTILASSTAIPDGYFFAYAVDRCKPVEEGDEDKEEQDPREPQGRMAQNASVLGNITIYPNPVTDQLNVSYLCKGNGQLNIVIKDVNGRLRKSEVLDCLDGTTVSHTVDVSAFETGVYFVELTLGKNHVVKKMVKL